MRWVRVLAGIAAAVAAAHSDAIVAQSSPGTQPRVQAADVHYLGSFDVETDWTNETNLTTYGGQALGIGPNNTLYFGGHDWYQHLCQITIPEIGGTASLVGDCVDIGGDWGSSDRLGGSLLYNGRLVVSKFTYYDATMGATVSHAVGRSDRTGFAAPQRVGELNPGLTAGYMGIIPAEWRTLLGGPAVTGQCCVSILGRTSGGPSLHVFNPDALGTGASVSTSPLVYYPYGHLPYREDSQNEFFNTATMMGGVAFVPGTRSVLFIGRQGTGPWSYSGGPNAGPYRHQIWAYDANDLVAVKTGAKQPWEVMPYGIWPLSQMDNSGTATINYGGAAFDPATRRLYVTERFGEDPRVHVYEIISGSDAPPLPDPPPPAPINCSVSSWSAWQAVTSWSACSGGTRSRTERRTRTVVTPAQNGGASCPALEDTRTVSQACTLPPPAEICGDLIDNNLDGQIDEDCPTACAVSAWSGWQPASAWSACSSNGTQTRSELRTRSVTAPAANGGAACPILQESRTATVACTPAPVPEVCGDDLDNDGDGEIDENCAAAPEPVPGPPAQLAAQVQGTTVTLNWLAPITGGTPTAYTIEAGSEPGQTTVSMPSPLQTSAHVTNVAPGRYYVRVRAGNASGAGAASNEVPLTVGCAGAPNRLEQFAAHTRSRVVTFTWVDPNGCSDTQYRVTIGSAPGASDIGQLTSDASRLTALAVPGRYFARAAAVTRFGESLPSEDIEVEVTTDACTPVDIPIALTATSIGRLVSIRWNPTDIAAARAADGVAPFEYVLEVGSAPGQSDLFRMTVGRSTSLVTLAPPGTYYVRARTADVCGLGPASNERLLRIR